jgi:hypothetical protein
VIIDATAARSAIEATFDSEIGFTRDAQGAEDDTYDPVTGTMVSSVGDKTPVWSGPCRVRPVTRISELGSSEGGQAIFRDRYLARCSFRSILVDVGDTGTVTASPDPQILGAEFLVTAVDGGSTSITRLIHMTRRRRGQRT